MEKVESRSRVDLNSDRQLGPSKVAERRHVVASGF